jgi:hypothetical protein
MKARLANLKVVIGLSKEGLRKLNKDIRDTRGKFRRNFGEIAGMAKNAALAITGTLVAGIGALIKKGAEMETLRTGFISITGSANKAAAVVKELNDFAANTPFQLEEISSAARKLLATGSKRSEITKELQFLGDVAASSGNSIDEIAAIFTKVRAKGKVELENLNQLAERNIPIFDELRKVTGDANMEFGAGAVSVEQFSQALRGMAEEGGIAQGAMENLSKTVEGRISTLLDNVGQELAGFAEKTGVTDAFGNLLENATEALKGVSGVTQTDLAAALGQAEEAMESFGSVTADNADEVETAMLAASDAISAVLKSAGEGTQQRGLFAALTGGTKGLKKSLQAQAQAVQPLIAIQEKLLEAGRNLNQQILEGTVAKNEEAAAAQALVDQFNAYNDAGLESTRVSSLLTAEHTKGIVSAKEYKEAVSGLTTALGIEGMTGALQEVAMEEEQLFDEGTAERIAFGTALLDRAKFAAENMGAAFSISSGLIGAAFDNIRDRSQGFHLYLKQMLTDLLKKALALAAAFAAMSILMSPAAMAKSGIGSFKDFMMGGFGLGNIPKMASGGLFSGASLALVGEGPGTSMSNPEVVAPLDKLQSMMGGGHVTVTGMIRGSDILISNERATLDRNRVRGF